jgi:hypothetical protein
MEKQISFNNLPVEPTITIINPDGSDLITTNNPIALLFARLEIKHNRWSGYKIRTANGAIIEILSNGKLDFWPYKQIPGDVAAELTMEIL